jgi:hypothetical protein
MPRGRALDYRRKRSPKPKNENMVCPQCGETQALGLVGYFDCKKRHAAKGMCLRYYPHSRKRETAA